MRAQITLRSGAQIEVDVVNLETTKNPGTQKITGMKWETPPNSTAKLHTVNLDEIVAIVVLQNTET